MLEAMARIAPSHPNEAIARIALRINGTTSLDPSCRVKIPEQGSLHVQGGLVPNKSSFDQGNQQEVVDSLALTKNSQPNGARSKNARIRKGLIFRFRGELSEKIFRRFCIFVIFHFSDFARNYRKNHFTDFSFL
jgi:hypothetical protein